MKILGVYAEDFPWDVRVEKILGGLASDGHDVSLVCRNLNRSPEFQNVGGLWCRRVLSPQFSSILQSALSIPAFFNPVWGRAIRRGIEDMNADLVIVRDLPLSLVAIREAKRRGIPCIVDMAENHPEMWRQVCINDKWKISYLLKNPFVAKKIEIEIARTADRIFVVVEEMKEHLISIGADPSKVVIVSNTPPLEYFSGFVDMRNENVFLEIIYAGFITNRRGLDQVVDALALLKDLEHPPRLNVYGQGSYIECLLSRARRLDVGSQLICHGFVDHRELPGLIARHDVGLVPHPKNGHTDCTIPNKIFEYMAVGLPVLVSNARPLERITTCLNCGLVFTDGDVGEIADRIRAFSDSALRMRMGKNGHEAVLSRYNWQMDYKNVEETIRSIVLL